MLIVELRIHGGMTQSDHQVTGFSVSQKTSFSGRRELSFSRVKFKVLYLDGGLDDTGVKIASSTSECLFEFIIFYFSCLLL